VSGLVISTVGPAAVLLSPAEDRADKH
jgi:hypothetical protein